MDSRCKYTIADFSAHHLVRQGGIWFEDQFYVAVLKTCQGFYASCPADSWGKIVGVSSVSASQVKEMPYMHDLLVGQNLRLWFPGCNFRLYVYDFRCDGIYRRKRESVSRADFKKV